MGFWVYRVAISLRVRVSRGFLFSASVFPMGDLKHIDQAPAPSSLDSESRKEAAQPTRVDNVLTYEFSDEELALFESCRQEAEDKTVIGHLPVKSPGYKILHEWAKSVFHDSFTTIALIGNGFFEVSFATKDGVLHTLTNTFFYEGKVVSFSTWSADFSSQKEETIDLVRFPVWAHFLGLPIYVRNEQCLRALGKRIGEILSMDLSDSWVGKTAGPRIRLLVSDINALPSTVLILGRVKGTTVEHKMTYSGLPDQCI